MVTKKSIWILVLFLLCSCTKQSQIQYVDRVVTVEVPIVQDIHFKRPDKPIDYLKNINDSSSSKEIAEAYVNTLIQYQEYTIKLEMLLEPFFENEKTP